MNYRHHFHAGNFADVMKHVVLIQLLRALQKKEKGFVYLDTHAGRGSYELATAELGDSHPREPEWPEGVGRRWSESSLSPAVGEYFELVRQFDHDRGNREARPRFYPGSPWFARLLARSQDRLVLCEKHPEEFGFLSNEFRFSPRTTVQLMDGYIALRAILPPPERRALVLIDPPYEQSDEFTQTLAGLRDGLARLPGGIFAIWYPLTERARVDRFLEELRLLQPPPTMVLELAIAGERAGFKMMGCGLAVINPPWKFEAVAQGAMTELGAAMAQGPGAEGSVRWLVPEQ